MFSAEGNHLQEILVEEAVRAADSLARNAAAQGWRALGAGAPLAAFTGLVAPPLALIPGVNIPILLSLVAGQNRDGVRLTLDDKRNLALLRSIAELVAPEFAKRLEQASAANPPGGMTANLTPEEARRLLATFQDIAPAVAPGRAKDGTRFRRPSLPRDSRSEARRTCGGSARRCRGARARRVSQRAREGGILPHLGRLRAGALTGEEEGEEGEEV